MNRESDSACIVEIRNRQRDVRFSIDVAALRGIVWAVLDSQKQWASCVGIEFSSDRMTRRLHKQFFCDPSSTDCMSFPIDDTPDAHGHRHLGDVVVCPLTAYLRSRGDVSVFWKELTLYTVHALLHLLGYDDIDPKARATMRRQEKRALTLASRRGFCLTGPVQLSNKLSVTKTKKYA